MRMITKNGSLNFRVSLWKKKIKDLQTKCSKQYMLSRGIKCKYVFRRGSDRKEN